MAKKSQLDKFKEAARKLEADESKERFGVVLKGLAKAAPAKARPKRQRKKRP